jgi:hypothetical protein
MLLGVFGAILFGLYDTLAFGFLRYERCCGQCTEWKESGVPILGGWDNFLGSSDNVCFACRRVWSTAGAVMGSDAVVPQLINATKSEDWDRCEAANTLLCLLFERNKNLFTQAELLAICSIKDLKKLYTPSDMDRCVFNLKDSPVEMDRISFKTVREQAHNLLTGREGTPAFPEDEAERVFWSSTWSPPKHRPRH